MIKKQWGTYTGELGVYGALGKMGQNHWKRLRQQHPQLNLWSLDLKEGKDYEKFLATENCDAYIIATPSETHYELAKSLIVQGKHVLIEKPVAFTYQEAKTLYRLAQEYNVALMAGHTERFNPIFRRALPELYGDHLLTFYRHAEKEGKEEDLIFDVMIHDLELYCYLENIDPWSEVELKETSHFQDGLTEIVLTHNDRTTAFSVAYGQPKERRQLVTENQIIDFLDVDEEPTDSLQGLHDHFLALCSQGATDYAWSAVAACGLAQQIQRELFG